MKKPSWCEKHFKIRRVVSELQNRSSHFNRTALYSLELLVFNGHKIQRISHYLQVQNFYILKIKVCFTYGESLQPLKDVDSGE